MPLLPPPTPTPLIPPTILPAHESELSKLNEESRIVNTWSVAFFSSFAEHRPPTASNFSHFAKLLLPIFYHITARYSSQFIQYQCPSPTTYYWHLSEWLWYTTCPAGRSRGGGAKIETHRNESWIDRRFSRPKPTSQANLKAACFQGRRELSNAPSYGRIGRVVRILARPRLDQICAHWHLLPEKWLYFERIFEAKTNFTGKTDGRMLSSSSRAFQRTLVW